MTFSMAICMALYCEPMAISEAYSIQYRARAGEGDCGGCGGASSSGRRCGGGGATTAGATVSLRRTAGVNGGESVEGGGEGGDGEGSSGQTRVGAREVARGGTAPVGWRRRSERRIDRNDGGSNGDDGGSEEESGVADRFCSDGAEGR